MDLAFYLLPIVVAGIGLLLIGVGRSKRKALRAAQQWPAAPGRIISSRVVESRSRDKDGNTDYRYHTSVKYEYTVGDRALTGDRIDLGWAGFESSRRGAHQKLADRYPAGQEVSVYYDPSQPEQCALERHASGSVSMFVLGGIFLIFGVFFGWLAAMGMFQGGDPAAVLRQLESPTPDEKK